MAQSTTSAYLRESVIRYLEICENLGQREMLLSQETVQALQKFQPQADETNPVSSRVSASMQRQPSLAIRADEQAQDARDVSSVSMESRKLDGLSKAAGLEVIRQEILSNRRLPELFRRAHNMVFGTGNTDARIMFIGEAPGADEDRLGEPFVGAAGKLLDKMIAAMGLERKDVYISNVVKYRPDMPEGSRGNRKPTPEELAQCRPYIMQQIAVIRPEVIVGLGATALEGLLDQPRVSITRLRGSWQELNGIPLMPTFHPAYLLHNDSISEKRKVWEDLLQVMEKTGMPISEKQLRFFKNKG